MTIKSKRPRWAQKSSYRKDLLNDLRSDKGYAAAYLSAALKDSMEAFLVALRDVAEAQKGIGRIAELAGVNRENLYRMLSQKGNPRLDSLLPVLKALDFSLVVEMNEGAPTRR
jgi:probable addiction module antidote protein